ncbi:hypothetical protein B0H34DRAFT_87291 [Crassisporium funariophilum]|nr:hypothetical protein B0H34DRAFT_87291 [Crassisporium funariophilum]
MSRFSSMVPAPEEDIGSFQPTSNAPLEHHIEFYLDDPGTSVFKVEYKYYKVHRFFFARESPVFQSMFDCPVPPEGQDGDSDERPIHLPEVTCAQFEALLHFFYNGMFGFNTERLFDLLLIALRYCFDRVASHAINAVDTCDVANDVEVVQKIILAIQFDQLQHWLAPAYIALIQRERPLTRTEIVRLGAGRTAILCERREQYLRKLDWQSPFDDVHDVDDVDYAVPEDFLTEPSD